MRYLILALVVLTGCVPVTEFSDDGSGVLVYPPPPQEIRQGDVIEVVNMTDEDLRCWTTWRVFDPSWSFDVPAGKRGSLELSEPRDVDGLPADSEYRNRVRFACAEDEGTGQRARIWVYSSRY